MNYPSDDRFNEDNFAKQPLILIEQALEAIEVRELEIGALISTPISRAMLYILASKGVKHPDREMDSLNPFAKALELAEIKNQISKEFAQVFMSLMQDGRVPAWVASQLDLGNIAIIAKG